MKTKAGIIGVIYLCALVTGCAMPSRKTAQQLADQYLTTAQAYETKGDLVKALDQYKRVLTVDPDNQLAQDKITQIGQKIQGLADTHYLRGMKYYRYGQYKQARQEFINALRYDPEHRQAKEMLTIDRKLEKIDKYVLHTIQPNESISRLAHIYYRDYKQFHLIALYNKLEDATKVSVGQQIKIPVVPWLPIMAEPSEIQTDAGKAREAKPGETLTVRRIIIHTVKADESLSKLAKMYYGDFKRYKLIAKFNDMQETDSLRVGQEIKIPEVEGVPFLVPELVPEKDKDSEEVKIPEKVPPPEEIPPKDEVIEPEKEKDEMIEEDQAAAYRDLGIELFNKKDYADAIIELQKALNVNPDDKVAGNYLSLAYFEQGVIFFDNEEYSQAIEALETSRRINSDCERCEMYIKQSEENFKDLHYRNGVSFFGQQKLDEAIEEWELVYKMDPDYKDVEENIKKARNWQERLKEIEEQSRQENSQN